MTTPNIHHNHTLWLNPGTTAIHMSVGLSQTIGLVLVELPEGFKGYVGVAEGADRIADGQQIAAYGGRIPDALAKRLWPHVDRWFDSNP